MIAAQRKLRNTNENSTGEPGYTLGSSPRRKKRGNALTRAMRVSITLLDWGEGMWIPVEEPGEFCPKNDEFFSLALLFYRVRLPKCTKLKAVVLLPSSTLNDMHHSNSPLKWLNKEVCSRQDL